MLEKRHLLAGSVSKVRAKYRRDDDGWLHRDVEVTLHIPGVSAKSIDDLAGHAAVLHKVEAQLWFEDTGSVEIEQGCDTFQLPLPLEMQERGWDPFKRDDVDPDTGEIRGDDGPPSAG